MPQQAVLDADFTKLLCSINVEGFFEKFMGSLGINPVIAWYVADEELIDCPKARELINRNIIRVIYPKDIFEDDISKTMFDRNFRDIYSKVNGEAIYNKADIFTKGFHQSGKNIGEIISELMAKELGLVLFASNDWGAKRYAANYINSTIFTLNVKNVVELIDDIVSSNKSSEFEWKEIKILLRDDDGKDRWKKDRNRLRNIWIQ